MVIDRVHPGPVCYRTLGHDEPWSLATYESLGGYQTWRKILAGEYSRQDIIDGVKASKLRGRGGAGFAAGVKWGFVPKQEGPKYLICNSDEGEPGTSKDHWILLYNPHQLIEGMAIAAYAMGMEVAYNYLRGEFKHPYDRCEAAIQEAIDAGLLGLNLGKQSIHMTIHTILGAGAYIVGEETAMIESLEGKRGQPRNKPPFPAVSGLYGCPTMVNNTETLASVPVIFEEGPEAFLARGTSQSGGTKLFSVSGHVQSPGVYELPLGIPFASLLEKVGGMREGRALKAVIPGGSSMRVVKAEAMMDANMSYEGLEAVGSSLGSGGVIVMDDSACMVEVLHNLMYFYAHESCGKCTPCREGSGWIFKALTRLLNGRAKPEDISEIERIAMGIEGRTICAFGEAISWPVTSFIQSFRDEFLFYAKHGYSQVKGKGV